MLPPSPFPIVLLVGNMEMALSQELQDVHCTGCEIRTCNRIMGGMGGWWFEES